MDLLISHPHLHLHPHTLTFTSTLTFPLPPTCSMEFRVAVRSLIQVPALCLRSTFEDR